MKALFYTAVNEITVRETACPEPAAGAVLIQTGATGICGSDMHAYQGHDARRQPELILGHEAAGTIVSGPRQGERVAVNPLITCGECSACQAGQEHLCGQRELIGMRRPGALAEFFTVPASNVVTVPASLDFVRASVAEPAATAYHMLKLAERLMSADWAGQQVLIIGGGSIGLLAALWLQQVQPKQVCLMQRNPNRRARLQSILSIPVRESVLSDTDLNQYDLVLDAVGSGESRQMATAALRPGGVLVHVGLMNDDAGLDIRKLTLQELICAGTYCYTMSEFCDTVHMLDQGVFGDLAWVETRSLAEGPEVFRDLLAGKIGAPKIVFVGH